MSRTTSAEAWQFPTLEFDYVDRAAPLEDAHAFLEYVRARAGMREAVMRLGERLHGVTRAAYDVMTSEERETFNDARRALLNHEQIAKTSSVRELRNAVADLLQGPSRFQRGGYYVAGPPGVGKTTAMTDALAAAVERHYRGKYGRDWWRLEPETMTRQWRNAHGDQGTAREVLVVPMMMPSRPSAREITLKMLHALSCAAGDSSLAVELERIRGRSKAREALLTDVLVERARIHGVRVFAIDELHYIKSDARGDEVVDHLKHLMNRTKAGFVLAGVSSKPESGLTVRAGRSTATDDQLRRRFTTITFMPFPEPDDGASPGTKMDRDWADVVLWLASKAVLLDQEASWWSDRETLWYLWRRTGGVFADLADLVRRAGTDAIGQPGRHESLVIEELEEIRLSDGADVTAGVYGVGPVARVGRPTSSAKRDRTPSIRKKGGKKPGVSKKGKKTSDDLGKASTRRCGTAIDPRNGFTA